jgi:hypothetical protein
MFISFYGKRWHNNTCYLNLLELRMVLKIAPNQKLDPGVYPEHMVYLKSAGICGQSDLVEVVNGKVILLIIKLIKN